MKDKLWNLYSKHKQTYKEIADSEHINIKTVQKRLDKSNIKQENIKPCDIVLIMDTTFFVGFGVMVFRSQELKKNLYWKYVKTERIDDYTAGVEHLQKQGWKILAIVCDGRRGIFNAFKDIPVQMCQFHQCQIVTRYITKNPKLSASIELKKLMLILVKTDKASFKWLLEEWHERWKEFLKEKSYNPETKKYCFTHRRLRSAYRSLKSNLEHLFVFEDYHRLNIPNTTNSLDGSFGHLKIKVNVHRGLKKHRKIKLIDQLLS